MYIVLLPCLAIAVAKKFIVISFYYEYYWDLNFLPNNQESPSVFPNSFLPFIETLFAMILKQIKIWSSHIKKIHFLSFFLFEYYAFRIELTFIFLFNFRLQSTKIQNVPNKKVLSWIQQISWCFQFSGCKIWSKLRVINIYCILKEIHH